MSISVLQDWCWVCLVWVYNQTDYKIRHAKDMTNNFVTAKHNIMLSRLPGTTIKFSPVEKVSTLEFLYQ